MSDKNEGSAEALKADIRHLRDKWRMIRADKQNRKHVLLNQGYNKNKIRGDRVYKNLKKEQHKISIRIKHMEKNLNRALASKNQDQEL